MEGYASILVSYKTSHTAPTDQPTNQPTNPPHHTLPHHPALECVGTYKPTLQPINQPTPHIIHFSPPTYPALESHAERIKRVHLRDLLQDASRNSALSVSANGILFDYSRQNATTEVGRGVWGVGKAL